LETDLENTLQIEQKTATGSKWWRLLVII